MSKNLFLFLVLFMAKSLLALPGPTVSCRFDAFNDKARLDFDESVTYVLLPGTGVTGNFDPYEIEITVERANFVIDIYLVDDLVSTIELPVVNIVALPFGASIFGVNTVYHEDKDGFFSMSYECIRVAP